MYLRTTHVQHGDKRYRYAQLVKSKRRESDGMVVKEVVANLGRLDDVTIANIRDALRAAKEGQRVVLARVKQLAPRKAGQSLRYLEVAVFLELWRMFRLDEMVSKLIPRGAATVSPTDVVAALVIHRCVDPGSKLKATRWFPRTALPELLGVSPTALENTRLHGVLDRLDEVSGDLMRELPTRYLEQDPAFSALFMDVSDAWFYGRGPEMAKHGRCKDDVIRRMIGILLLCNEYGYPLRWQALPGNHAETAAMLDQFRALSYVRWAKDVPVVVDRALGRTGYLRQLLETGICFVTALVRPEFPNYAPELPYQSGASYPLTGSREEQIRALGDWAVKSGLSRIDDSLYVRDLGIVEHNPGKSTASPTPQPDDPDDRCRFALQMVRSIDEAIRIGAAPSLTRAARDRGLSKATLMKYRKLTQLAEPLQTAVLEGQARGVALSQLIAVSQQMPEAQTDAFNALVSTSSQRTTPQAPRFAPPSSREPSGDSVTRLRAVAYFNPSVFLDQREKAEKKLRRIEESVAELNQQLLSPRSRRSREAVAAAVDRILRKKDLLDAFDVQIEESEHPTLQRSVFQVTLTLRANDWARRTRFAGFSVLVTRPDFEIKSERLCQLYRAKDIAETDFRVIKSQVKLSPIFHHNDSKVRAHVTICMLALLLERTLRRMLGDTMTAAQALEYLRDCRLDRHADDTGTSAYIIAGDDPQLTSILKTLGMEHLINDDQMAEMIHPR